jgi:dTDP-4-dehydrorhamnose 3,5-epimerase
MNVIETSLPGVLVIEPQIFSDTRGFFFESFNEYAFGQQTGVGRRFVQDNHSHSAQHVLRGLHYQIRQPQGKLVRVVAGEVFDVAVDLRASSPTFGQWTGVYLSAANRRMFWIPEGFAHGFLVVSSSADVLYKTTAYWAQQEERCILWNDPDLDIDWPLTAAPVLSSKDQLGLPFLQAEVFADASSDAACERAWQPGAG